MFKTQNIDNYSFLMKYSSLLYKTKGIISGGCFKNIFNNEKVKDIDLFFRNLNDFNKAINYFKSVSKIYLLLYENDNVICFLDKEHDIRIECIRKIFGNPEELLNSFDFTITKFTFYINPEKSEELLSITNFDKLEVMYHENFFEHLHLKRLVIDDKLYFPFSTFERSYRYTSYGYKLCRESKMKLLKEISENYNSEIELAQSLYSGID